MKKIIATLVTVAVAGICQAAQTTNLFPNGNFEAGLGDWVEAGGPVNFSYPSTGGNPDGYGLIDATPGGWGIWVGGAVEPISLTSLGLTAGQTYTFVQDMRIEYGDSIGGLKVESWNATQSLGDSGDMRPASGSSEWATYTFTYTIHPAATGLKVVPLWGPNSMVAFDNIGVLVPAPSPVAVSITTPTNNQVVYSNFTVSATATVYPGAVTNVSFYLDDTLLGHDSTSPFSWSATSIPAGAHTLKAVAKDSSGEQATSAVIPITVTSAAPPAVKIYESFNYPVGSLANGTPATGTGFAGNWVLPAGSASIVAGLSYNGLMAENNAMQQVNGSGRSVVNFATVLSSGTKYISFLIQGSGDSGGNWAGVFLKGDNSTSLFAGFRGGFSATATMFGLGSVNSGSTTPTGGTAYGSAVPLHNTDTHLIVLKIDFNTSGMNDTVSFWADPPAGTDAPGVAASASYSAYDVGTISAIGLNLQGGSPRLTIDEIRVGNSYAEVVGGDLAPTIPTSLALSVVAGKQVTWPAVNNNYYTVQKSQDGSTWEDMIENVSGAATSSIYDAAPAPFYQVLEKAPSVSEQIMDGGFELEDGYGGAFYWVGIGTQPPSRITSEYRNGTACLSLAVTNAAATPNASEVQQGLAYAGGGPVTPGNTYAFSFWAKQNGAGPSYVQQYKLSWLDSGGAVVGAVGWSGFTGGVDEWKQISAGSVIAPAGAVNALIQIRGNTGAVQGGFGGVLIDDVSLAGSSPGEVIGVLTPTIASGASFAATVQANGFPATAAQGTVMFKTNDVAQSAATLANGSAASTPAIVPSSYTLTAIYSGDATYIGSTATIVVGGGGGHFGTEPGSVALNGSVATISLSGVEGNTYSIQRATNPLFNQGLRNFPVTTAPAGGMVSVTDDFSDLGVVPPAAYYRLQYIP